MKHLLIIITCLLFFDSCFGQKDSLKLNDINIELLGPAFYGSINYERIVKMDNDFFLDLSFGGMYYPNSNTLLIIPQVNLLFGHKSFFEMGYTLINFYDDGSSERHNSIRLGYRYQDLKNGGFMFRAGFTPIFGLEFMGEKNDLPWIGVTFGYGF